MKMKKSKYLDLFLTFLKIGAFSFGSGYAMISIIEEEIVNKKKWLNKSQIFEMITIAESTPGPIAINSATFVGYKIGGFLGALVSTIGVSLPSFIIIIIISNILDLFKANIYVSNAFFGIKIGVLVLILNALISLYKELNKDILSYVIMIISFVLILFFNISAIYIILGFIIFSLLEMRFRHE